jgi:hypothetical protein
LPSWAPDLVILRGFFKQGERKQYFVDGIRSQGLLTHFLPIIEPQHCGRTDFLEGAMVDLRVLQDGPPTSGIRIIGRVYTDMYAASEPARGAKLLITGPTGTISTATDQQGIYDLIGLPPGHYIVEIELENQRRYSYRSEGDVKPGEVWGSDLIAYHAQPSAP